MKPIRKQIYTKLRSESENVFIFDPAKILHINWAKIWNDIIHESSPSIREQIRETVKYETN